MDTHQLAVKSLSRGQRGGPYQPQRLKGTSTKFNESRKAQQEANDTHNKACLKATENQEQFDSAEKECYASFSKYTKDLDKETFKAKEEEYYDWTCVF